MTSGRLGGARYFTGVQRILLPTLAFVVAWAILALSIRSLTQGNTLGTDFYIFYHAGQTAIVDRADPYSDQQALQNQLAIFKRPAAPGEDHLGFGYPPYALLAVWPLLWLNFSWAQAIWAAFLILSTVGAIMLSFRGAPPWIGISLLFFYPVTFGLILGNFSILIAALFLLVFGLVTGRPLRSGWQMFLGFLLAWLTVKPQFLWLLVILVLLYTLRRRLWSFWVGFGLGMAIFLLISFAIVPNWPGLWLGSLNNTLYNQSGLTITIFLAEILPEPWIIPITAVLAGLTLIITVYLFARWWRDRLELLLLLAWCGFALYLFHPRGASYEMIAFLIPVIVWVIQQKKSWRSAPVLVFWFGILIFTWIVFFLSIQSGAPKSINEWPFLFYTIWLGWLFLIRRVDLPLAAAG